MSKTIKFNKVTKKLPKHLHKFIVKQPYKDYTAQNQAVWRYVMRMNIDYLSKVAHTSYTEGLEKTGISTERIPKMSGMNRILKDIGWAAHRRTASTWNTSTANESRTRESDS